MTSANTKVASTIGSRRPRAVLAVEAWIEGDGWRQEAGERHALPTRDLARQVLKRLHRKLLRDGRRIVIPGTGLRAMTLVPRLLPRSLLARGTRRMQNRS